MPSDNTALHDLADTVWDMILQAIARDFSLHLTVRISEAGGSVIVASFDEECELHLLSSLPDGSAFALPAAITLDDRDAGERIVAVVGAPEQASVH